MNNILITGCNGLIGSSLVAQLKKNDSVRLFGVGRSVKTIANTFIIDLAKDWSDAYLPERMDVIIHLAQSEKFRDFPISAAEIFNVNTGSTLKLLDYARKAGVKKFIYASSGGIYGDSQDKFYDETPVFMRSDIGFYLSTKFCSDLLVQNYSKLFDIDILRFFFVYGAHQHKDMLIHRLVNSVLHGREIVLNGDEGAKINPIYVDDAAKAIVKFIELEGSHKINIAGPEILSLKTIVNIIADKLGKKAVIKYADQPAQHYFADIAKMKQLLIEPKVKFREGIAEIISKYA